MRFAWKVTLASLCILVLSIGMGSHLLISISFRSTLNREIAVAQEEMQMLRIAYEAVCDARGITLENLAQQGKSLQRTLQGDAYFTDHQFRVSTRDGEQVYSTLDAGGDRELLEAIDGLSSGYVLRRADPAGRVLIHCAGPVSLPDGMLYMETLRDITSLFADRETHYQVYRWILLIVVGIGAAVMYALSFWLTRPIRALGRAATALAGGDYAARAQVTTGDEIGELAFYFNRMAGAIEQNVRDLEDAARRQEDFTASFVHELKTPLTSIIGYADMLRSRDLEEDMRFKAASYIFSEGKRLEKLSLSLMSLLVVGHSEADVKTWSRTCWTTPARPPRPGRGSPSPARPWLPAGTASLSPTRAGASPPMRSGRSPRPSIWWTSPAHGPREAPDWASPCARPSPPSTAGPSASRARRAGAPPSPWS